MKHPHLASPLKGEGSDNNKTDLLLIEIFYSSFRELAKVEPAFRMKPIEMTVGHLFKCAVEKAGCGD